VVPLKLRFRAAQQALTSPAPVTLRLREAATEASPFRLGSDRFSDAGSHRLSPTADSLWKARDQPSPSSLF